MAIFRLCKNSPQHGVLLALCGLCWSMAAGCGWGPTPVNVEVANTTLRSAMESWKAGKTPEQVQGGSPSIVVQDLDWNSGATLLAYEVVDDAKPMDQNLMAHVKLKLRDSKGVEGEKTATYVVGTSPVLTVFRDMMH